MLPDLLILEKKKAFSKQEIADIVKEREKIEYTLLRTNSSKKDFLKAIEFEYRLERKRL